MPEPATADRRPSPKPRTVDHPHLTVVPPPTEAPAVTLQPDPETEPAAGQDTPAHTSSQVSDHPDSANPAPARLQVAELWSSARHAAARSRDYWTPPAIFTDRPASLAELADYARHAPWTAQRTGLIRKAGVGYYRGAAYPATVACRYWEWVWQRPLRLAAHLGAIKLLAHTTPGIWVVDHVIYPAATIAGHILL